MANLERVNTADASSLKCHRGWLFAIGIILLLLGCVGLGMEVMLTLVSMYFFAVLLMISGLSHFADAFKYKEWKGAVWQILITVLYLIAGFVVLYDPLLVSTMLTAVLGWLLIVIGAARVFMSFHLKGSRGWGWILFAGVVSFILGLLILLQWPVSGLWVIGMFIAIDMIVTGWTYIFTAIALRS